MKYWFVDVASNYVKVKAGKEHTALFKAGFLIDKCLAIGSKTTVTLLRVSERNFDHSTRRLIK